MTKDNNEQGELFLILKDYTSPKKKIHLKAGDILNEEPKVMDRRDYVKYNSRKQMVDNLLDDMYNLSRTRNDIDFKAFELIPVKHQIKLNKWTRDNIYNQAYINRVITDDACIIGVMVVTSGGLFSYRAEVPYSKNIDNLVIVAYHKILGYLREREPLDIDVIHAGFAIPEHELPHGNILYHMPGNYTTTNPQLFQMFNHYLTTGEKLIPLIEVKL